MNEVMVGVGTGSGTETGKEEKKNGGRKLEKEKEIEVKKGEQSKFFIDLSKDKKVLEKIFSLLSKANDKAYGREISFKDLLVFAIEGVTEKDLEKLKETSLSEMERVQRHLDEYNQKNKTTLGLGEFLIKKLNIA